MMKQGRWRHLTAPTGITGGCPASHVAVLPVLLSETGRPGGGHGALTGVRGVP